MKSMQAISSDRKKLRATDIIRREWQYELLVLPGLVMILLFCFVPMFGIVMAFQDYVPMRGMFASDYLGLYWFEYAFSLPDIWRIVRNTFEIATLKTIIGFPVPILFALLLNEVRCVKYKKTIQTVLYLPNFLSWIIISGIIIDVFALSGIVNQAIKAFGLPGVYFLGEEDSFRALVIGSDIWKNFGWGTVIYMSALSGVDPALYEAAAIDGAGRIRQTWHITLPGIGQVVLMVAVLNMGNLVNAGFDQIFNLYNPLVMSSADIIDTYTYRLAFMDARWSLSTAVGLLRSLVSTTFIGAGYYLAYKLTDYRIF